MCIYHDLTLVFRFLPFFCNDWNQHKHPKEFEESLSKLSIDELSTDLTTIREELEALKRAGGVSSSSTIVKDKQSTHQEGEEKRQALSSQFEVVDMNINEESISRHLDT